MAAPWLSVLMPTYNGEEFIESTLQSIEREACDGLEVIVCDDGSTDQTRDVLSRYSKRVQLEVVSCERVGNWVAGTNTALRAASGTYACILHQDDVWLEGHRATVAAAVAANPHAEFLLQSAVFLGRHGELLGPWTCPLPRTGASITPVAFLERLLVQNFIAIPAPVFRREAALDIGGLDERLWFTADWDLWLRLGARAGVLFLPGATTGFRVHEASQTHSRRRTAAEFRDQLEQVLYRHFEPWARQARPHLARRVEKAARFSVEVNVALSSAYAREEVAWHTVLRSSFALGPKGWSRYLRDSRITERLISRLRARRTR